MISFNALIVAPPRQVAELDERHATLEGDIAEREADERALQTEKELQSGGEIKELAAVVDKLSKQ